MHAIRRYAIITVIMTNGREYNFERVTLLTSLRLKIEEKEEHEEAEDLV